MMLEFDRELERLKAREGFWSDDPDDRGGQTIFGIARRRWPGWLGWTVVDEYRRSGRLAQLEDDANFAELVRRHYHDSFWLPCGAQFVSDAIAALLFDAAVNHGVERGTLFLQQALNALNRNGELWEDLVEDGVIGPRTERAMAEALDRYADDLAWSLIVIRGAFYHGLTRSDRSQEKWYRGWMRRARELYEQTKEGGA